MLFSYCSGGAYLTTQCQSIGDAVFMSNWWMQTQSKLCKNLLLVICRSQKMDRLTAGKMFDLNLKTFAGVIKTAFSFFMVIQAVYVKSLQNKQLK
ncbi:hypothetical protein ILUMI_13057 [Ignelater luminosus]|uniref:Uncharacterized protein n=1 Tax=Ignelater luminosus TaxID=2038154 RepID=A0A8K0CV76_IGNLU|nr:hypothetical protein ILUMI_13057 [Ignelater luminosus]